MCFLEIRGADQLLLQIPLAPVLDRRSGIRTDATTNSEACSTSHLTSKMTYSNVIAVTRTAVLIKEGSVFCIALNDKAFLFPCLSWWKKPPKISSVPGEQKKAFFERWKDGFHIANSSSRSPLRAGRLGTSINALNLEEKIDDLSITVLKEQIEYQLKPLLSIYKDTTDINFSLPPERNLEQVASSIFFQEETVQSLNDIYCSLLNQGTASPYFVQALEFRISFGG